MTFHARESAFRRANTAPDQRIPSVEEDWMGTVHQRAASPGRRRARPRAAMAVAAATCLALVAGCGGGGEETSDDGRITLQVGLYGVFGYEQAGLFEEYERLNPDIRIEAQAAGEEDVYYQNLLTRIGGGGDLMDIQAIEVGRIKEIVDQHADVFSDLSQVPGVEPTDWPEWKSAQATTADGRLIGAGTDIGPMAVCYRTDFFEQAGLPTDREAVSQLWASGWDAYVDTGEQFMASGPEGVAFMDTASGLYNAAISASPLQYYDESGNLIYQENPAVQEAWDVAARAAGSGMTAGLRQFETGWEQAFGDNAFATVICPSWMLAQVQLFAGEENAGKWDVARAPHGANWGGSFLAVPEESEHKEEAQALAAWLTAPEQQQRVFTQEAIFPSSVEAMESDTVRGATLEYFNGAPIGEIFVAAAEEVPTITLGSRDGVIMDAIAEGIERIEQGADPAESWEASVAEIGRIVG
ncbi:ABC transporter substrate-binding protein [Allostreptomyces psammosilenae]|uniref:Cellobiose transport system substrate-binding protein n=1 Tax=Allostreptomyces psammosilenae TaxID=1892865 RepID=A0A852ZYB3_9ACTN|nr:extracellular solute-binding protein [Allostreptomyces psammosilenae]NYI03611.1 cellobiose transport system substrate-binding protein [Allostreptomyces psammosilenae]